MSVEALSIVLNSTSSTDSLQKLILLGLANHADGYGRSARPSQRTLARYAQCGVRSVQRKLGELEAAGVICRGDQRLTDHLRGDRRPVVWDLNLRGLLASSVVPDEPEEDPSRGATQTPRDLSRHVTPDAHDPSTVAYRTVPGTIPPRSPTTARARRLAEQARLAGLDAQAREDERAAAALARREQIDACEMCDDQGQRDGEPCHHDPDRGARARRWTDQIRRERGWSDVSISRDQRKSTG